MADAGLTAAEAQTAPKQTTSGAYVTGGPDARRDLIRWIEGWFNPRRLHSTLGYRSPIETETDWYRDQTEAHPEAA